jgi:hypothetical protein
MFKDHVARCMFATGPIVIAVAIAGGGIGMTKDAPIFGCSRP